MRSIKQRSCYSFWRLRDCGTAEAALQLECGTARARKQHCNSNAALREQFFELDILWAGYSEISPLNICLHNKFEFSI